jgi:hypothetical protein
MAIKPECLYSTSFYGLSNVLELGQQNTHRDWKHWNKKKLAKTDRQPCFSTSAQTVTRKSIIHCHLVSQRKCWIELWGQVEITSIFSIVRCIRRSRHFRFFLNRCHHKRLSDDAPLGGVEASRASSPPGKGCIINTRHICLYMQNALLGEGEGASSNKALGPTKLHLNLALMFNWRFILTRKWHWPVTTKHKTWDCIHFIFSFLQMDLLS